MSVSMVTSNTLGYNFEILLVSAHIGRLFNDNSSFDIDVGACIFLFECDSLIDAIAPVETQ